MDLILWFRITARLPQSTTQPTLTFSFVNLSQHRTASVSSGTTPEDIEYEKRMIRSETSFGMTNMLVFASISSSSFVIL